MRHPTACFPFPRNLHSSRDNRASEFSARLDVRGPCLGGGPQSSLPYHGRTLKKAYSNKGHLTSMLPCASQRIPSFSGFSTSSPTKRTEDGPEPFKADISPLYPWPSLAPVNREHNSTFAINFGSLFRIAMLTSDGDHTHLILLLLPPLFTRACRS